jgi:repressor LexA
MKKCEIDEKLNELFHFTVDFIDQNGYSPSIRDICAALNIKSTATAYSYVNKLKSKGLLEHSPLKKRALKVSNKANNFRNVPIIGTIQAGQPIFAVENLEGYCPLPEDFSDAEDSFALRVKGSSMVNAGIYENDLIIVRKQDTAENGEIVIALIDDSATVKRFYLTDGKIILHPENDSMSDMVFESVNILGVVKGLIRKI